MNIIELISGERIQQAIADGQFGNLQGQGKPLLEIMDDDTSAETRLTHLIIKMNGFILPWIDLQKEIQSEFTGARSFLERVCPVGNESGLNRKVLQQFGEKAEKINRLIRMYNLKVPLTSLQYLPLCVEKEGSDFERKLFNDFPYMERILL